MTYPIPGVGVSTPYGKRGSHWSCQKDSSGNGIHTGADFAAGSGTKIYAPIAGQIRHRSYGSAFGNHQFAISPDAGQPFADGEVFFAHTRTRPKDGAYVKVGDLIAEVGAEGNVTGPHLHMEYMPSTKDQWKCGIHANPQPVLDHAVVSHGGVYLSKLKFGQQDSDSVSRLQMHLNAHKLEGGATIEVVGHYGEKTDHEVRLCQQQHGFGNDPANASSVGPKQAAHLFTGCACVIHDDVTEPAPPEPEPTPPPDQGGDVSYFHDYTGKPSGTLTISDGQGYVALDAKCKPAPFSGAEFHMLYINAECTWDSSGDDGIIRVKYVRDAFGGEPADDTGYQDYAVPKGEALGDPDGFLITATHWEAGEAGRGGRWHIRCAGALKSIKIGTRYAKVVVVK